MRRHRPQDHPPGLQTDRGLDRLVNFTDATVAIAITVLVLPLVDLARDVDTERFSDLLSQNRSAIIGFTVTFVVIGRLWTTHHRIFESVAGYDEGLITWCLVWLFAIVSLPFAANVLSNLGDFDDPGAYAFYIGTILLATVSLVGTGEHLRRRPALLRPDAPAHDAMGGYVMVGLVAVALVVAVTVPAINLWSLFLLFLAGPITAVISRRRSATPS
jgi:uncharacterized membrane protein